MWRGHHKLKEWSMKKHCILQKTKTFSSRFKCKMHEENRQKLFRVGQSTQMSTIWKDQASNFFKKQCPTLGFRGVSLLHPNIRIHFLHNLLHKFPLVLTRRICLTIKSFPHDLNEAFSCITLRKNFKLVTQDLKGSCSIILD